MKSFLSCLLLLSLVALRATAEDAPKFTVHETALWIIEQDAKLANARNAFKPALPGTSVRMAAQVGPPQNQGMINGMIVQAPNQFVVANAPQAAPAAGTPARLTAPVAMLTFHGQPTNSLDVEVRAKRGALLAHWPPGDATSNRLRWSDPAPTRLVSKIDDESSLPFVEADHWIRKARENESLYVSRGARSERFLAYDAELQLTSPTKLVIKDDTLTLTNISAYTLYDVLVAQPTADGVRVAWLDSLPPAKLAPASTNPAAARAAEFKEQAKVAAEKAAANNAAKDVDDLFTEAPAAAVPAVVEDASKPADVKLDPTAGVLLAMSATLEKGSKELEQQTLGELTARLSRAGLNEHEVELYLNRNASRFFDETAVIVACRLDPAAIDEALPLSIFPAPAQLSRVHYVVSRNADPRLGSEVDRLIVQLGDKDFAIRETSQKRLLELGSVAFPSLQKAVGHADLEVVIRAERILLSQNQTPNAAPPQAAKPVLGAPGAAPAAAPAQPVQPVGRAVVPN